MQRKLRRNLLHGRAECCCTELYREPLVATALTPHARATPREVWCESVVLNASSGMLVKRRSAALAKAERRATRLRKSTTNFREPRRERRRFWSNQLGKRCMGTLVLRIWWTDPTHTRRTGRHSL